MISAHLHPQRGAYLAKGDKKHSMTTLRQRARAHTRFNKIN